MQPYYRGFGKRSLDLMWQERVSQETCSRESWDLAVLQRLDRVRKPWIKDVVREAKPVCPGNLEKKRKIWTCGK